MKSVHIWSFSGPYFPVFELNTDIAGGKGLFKGGIYLPKGAGFVREWSYFRLITGNSEKLFLK